MFFCWCRVSCISNSLQQMSNVVITCRYHNVAWNVTHHQHCEQVPSWCELCIINLWKETLWGQLKVCSWSVGMISNWKRYDSRILWSALDIQLRTLHIYSLESFVLVKLRKMFWCEFYTHTHSSTLTTLEIICRCPMNLGISLNQHYNLLTAEVVHGSIRISIPSSNRTMKELAGLGFLLSDPFITNIQTYWATLSREC